MRRQSAVTCRILILAICAPAMLKRLRDPDLGNSVRLGQVEGMRIDPDHILLVAEWSVV